MTSAWVKSDDGKAWVGRPPWGSLGLTLHLQQVAGGHIQVSPGIPEDGDPPLLGNPSEGCPLPQGKSLFPTQCLWRPGNNKSRSTTANTSICGLYSTKSLKVLLKSVVPLRNQILLVE